MGSYSKNIVCESYNILLRTFLLGIVCVLGWEGFGVLFTNVEEHIFTRFHLEQLFGSRSM